VLAAAGRADLSGVYLGLLVLSTALFLRLFYGGAVGLPVPSGNLPLAWPKPVPLLRHAGSQSWDFVKDVATVFSAVCALAALAAWSGILGLLERAAAPLMALLGLPVQVADAVVMSAVRKNGMATVLIAPEGGLKVPLASASQLLAAVLLAGLLLPCVVTSLALGKELGWRRAGHLLVRQMAVVTILVGILSWSGALLGF
jgi:ferrous iron transport protein B